jgi:hypothetical protein
VLTSLLVCSIAFLTSVLSTSETMSKVGTAYSYKKMKNKILSTKSTKNTNKANIKRQAKR